MKPARLAIILGLSSVVVSAAVIAVPGPARRLLARSLPPDASSPRFVTGSPGSDTFFPSSGRVKAGVNYRYTLFTHCGLDSKVDFDGSLWTFAGPGPADDGSGNPPPGFANPQDLGTMRLVAPDVSEYRSSANSIVRYHRRDGPQVVQICD